MDKKISLDKLSNEIKDILDKYNDSIIIGVKDKITKSAKELVKITRRDANKRTGGYIKHIKSRVLKETTSSIAYQWYVSDQHGRRTHLLIRPHKTRNGGQTTGNDFLSNNVDDVERDMLKKIEEVIKSGY